MDLPKDYKVHKVEEKWLDDWDSSLYSYDIESDSPDYIIDTPPPYPTGNLHIGNALGWCYMDFIARYKRLKGFNVLFPQGWDCHGLPTEVKVEEKYGKKSEIERDRFRKLCEEYTMDRIDEMKKTMKRLGFSQDWNHEYITMDPEYWGETQRTFIEMVEKDYIYKDHHPVNWCPRCETAIADAEVERTQKNGDFFYIEFPSVNEGSEGINIATTRPELLSACGAIAVHPDDDRFKDKIGERFKVPLFGQQIEVIADEDADPEFGTGAVMICTFGDKQDVEWWQKHGLDLREAFTKQGRLTDIADKYQGLKIDEGKTEIVEGLKEKGFIYDQEEIDQNIRICWRCDSPVEILAEEQWFVEVNQDEILEKARQVEWIPEDGYKRLKEWTESMEWDWVISRQRIFATPFPVWYCNNCNNVKVADKTDIPLDPTNQKPNENCKECGSRDWRPEKDVMDTWMDSSISAFYVATKLIDKDRQFNPTQLREQGHDIIRTWAFYTILRTAALEDEIPWEEALINGMVFGEDGHKMSKSRGNFVQPEEVIDEAGTDAFRQSMASAGRPGSDVQFQWKEVERASRFLTKSWNVYRFAVPHISEYTEYDRSDRPNLRLADKWILSKFSDLIKESEELMEEYRFDTALKTLQGFLWDDLADDYIELVKNRLYSGDKAAKWTIRTILNDFAIIFSPIAPFFSEEAYYYLNDKSVNKANWPVLEFYDKDAIERGELLTEIVASVRRWKSENGIPLNRELEHIEIYTDKQLDKLDAENALNSDIILKKGEPELEKIPVDLEVDMSILGPKFKDKAKDVAEKLKNKNLEAIQKRIKEDNIQVELNGEQVQVQSEALDIDMKLRSRGREVDIIDMKEATVLIFD